MLTSWLKCTYYTDRTSEKLRTNTHYMTIFSKKISAKYHFNPLVYNTSTNQFVDGKYETLTYPIIMMKFLKWHNVYFLHLHKVLAHSVNVYVHHNMYMTILPYHYLLFTAALNAQRILSPIPQQT